MINLLSALSSRGRRLTTALLLVLIMLGGMSGNVAAHPLGNFSINHFARIEASSGRVRVHYVIDMAEIPTFQESQSIDTDTDGKLSDTELNNYLERVAAQYADGLILTVDEARLPLQTIAKTISAVQGSGNLPTLRVECDFEGIMPATDGTTRPLRLHFEDTNYGERLGWREIVVVAASGMAVFDSTAFGSALTDELKAYPEDMLAAPLAERTAAFSVSTGAMPPGAAGLRTREGRPVVQTQDSFAGLIAVPEVTLGVALLGLLFAGGLGALHALSPGHGKTVVGAYLVGSRGTPRHAVYLGLTVTITHTIGVFALGLVTLFASQYVMPERLFPILTLVSGAIVLGIGLSLFTRRLRAALGYATPLHAHHDHSHPHAHEHDHDHQHLHAHDHSHGDAGEASLTHSHGGTTHTHLPPGADGSPVTWRSLLALGISGGLLPCPSALVVLLSAISLHRVGYGLALVFAFSVGLAATLMGIGLMFVYAGRFIKRPVGDSAVVRWLPIVSALVIACIGAAICFEALTETGVNFSALASYLAGGEERALLASPGGFALLGLGLVFGLKHATEADHVIAVSAIVSEHRNILRSALVGGLWGVGHTASLVIVGVVVLALRIAIPEQVATWLEFGVALMIIGLGINAFMRALRGRTDVHVHVHAHDEGTHAHIHFHEDGTEHAGTVAAHSHAISRIGIKPVLVGAVHGLAGSAALTLLVLTQIDSFLLGLLYLAIFGVGSICGMLLMSGLIGLPFALSARRLSGFNYGLQTVAGAVSIGFGLWYAYSTGLVSGL